MTVKAKICGLKTMEAVKAAVGNGAAYLGFVIYGPSPRNISPEDTGKLIADIPKKIKKVAVVVDPSDTLLEQIQKEMKPDYVQLHGSESVKRVKEIKKKFGFKIIKAVKIRSSDDVALGQSYQDAADMLLFDARPWDNMPGALPGGNGVSFDWQLLKDRKFSLPWVLSGGLSPDNVKQAVEVTGAKIVDVSSSLEIKPGEKDIELIKKFLRAAKSIK